jgi:S-adenosylmethionine hydrolase
MERVITLTTDFGTRDHYVGTMKGVILNIHRSALIVDICHSVPPYDVLEGALTIAQAYSYFPPGTVHMVVVDPGVGSSRRPILADTGKYRFIAPDNGVLSLVYAREERVQVRHITAEHYFLNPVSATFHGRDIFAPVAAYVSKGVSLPMLGEEIDDYVRFTIRPPQPVSEKELTGVVLKVDTFGNLVTNLRPQDVPALSEEPTPDFCLKVGTGEVRSIKPTFSAGDPGEVFALWGSMGFLEIVANCGSAAQILGVGKGAKVGLVLA